MAETAGDNKKTAIFVVWKGGPIPQNKKHALKSTHRYTNIAMDIHLFSGQMPSKLWIFYGYVSLPECNYHCFEVSTNYHVYTPCHSLAYHVGFRLFLINTQLGAVWYTKREPKHDMMIRYHICMFFTYRYKYTFTDVHT